MLNSNIVDFAPISCSFAGTPDRFHSMATACGSLSKDLTAFCIEKVLFQQKFLCCQASSESYCITYHLFFEIKAPDSVCYVPNFITASEEDELLRKVSEETVTTIIFVELTVKREKETCIQLYSNKYTRTVDHQVGTRIGQFCALQGGGGGYIELPVPPLDLLLKLRESIFLMTVLGNFTWN